MRRENSIYLRIVVPILILSVILPVSTFAQWGGTDEEFIAMVESNNWEFFLFNQGGPYSFFRGSGHYDEQYSYDTLGTCSSDGFGLAALCVGVYRGWMDYDTAYNRILPLLKSYQTQLQRDGYGFFNHYYGFTNGLPVAEYSPIDSTWFICGAIMAAEYFKGTEIEAVANNIYDGMNYRDGVNPYWSGYFEFIIMNIVGAGSPTNGWAPATSKDAWEVCTKQVNYYGPLFWYQWPQAFVDFRFRVDGIGTNHFQNAIDAYLIQQQKCIDLHNSDPVNYPDFGTNGWGLTSATSSRGYLEMRPFGNWCTYNTNLYNPISGCTNHIDTDEKACDSGTLVPVCLPASMSHTPYEAREAMKHIYNTYDPMFNVYGRYGFINAFNTGEALSTNEHYSPINATMDNGCNVIVVENFRSGMPWKYFMSHPYISSGMTNCGFTIPNIAYHDDWNDGSDPNVWTGSTTVANTDGTDPIVTYESIPYYTNWVNGYARKVVANGSGDVVRLGLAETDQSKNDLLSFWIRGEAGGEQFDVGLGDAEGHETRFPIEEFVPGGTVPTNWYRVRIPLRDYAVSVDPNNDVRILFLGDYSLQFRSGGTVYMDDLAFVMDDIEPDPPPSFGAACIEGRVHMRWTPSTHDDVTGYNLWRRPEPSGGFTQLNSLVVAGRYAETDAVVESEWGEDFYYAAQSQDRRGNAGAFTSAELEQHVLVGRHRDLDWGDGQNPNTLGGNDDTWGSSWRDIRFERQDGWDGRSNWVRVCEGDTDCGVFIQLKDSDLGSYDALCFWLKKNWGADDFDLGLISTNGTERKVDIRGYVPGGVIPTNWTYVTIPFIDCTGVVFTAMNNLSLTFHTPGSVYLDDIRFVKLEEDRDICMVLEAELVGGHTGGTTNDFKDAASGLRVLGGGWASNVNDDAWWVICPSNEMNEAYLDVRYACGTATNRTLEVYVDSDLRATLTTQPTGGWGDEPAHFTEDTLRLGRITYDCFLLKLKAPDTGSAVNLDRVVLRTGTRYFREAEHFDMQSGSTTTDYKSGASGGQVLGATWGSGNGHFAEYTNIVFSTPVSGAVLRVRYGQDWGDGRLIRVRLNGVDMGQVAFFRTGGWLEQYFEGTWAELPLGTVTGGTYTLRFETEGIEDAVNLDWIRIDEEAAGTKAVDSDGDGIPDHGELLYGTSVSQADPDGDGLSDMEELSRLGGGYLTYPNDPDTDDDNMNDGEEVIAGTSPVDAGSRFEFLSATPRFEATGLLLNWRGSADASYSVEYRDEGMSSTSAYHAVTDPESITVTNTTVNYRDDGNGTSPAPQDPALRRRFYRIRAYKP